MNIFLSTFGNNTEIIKESLGLFCFGDCVVDYYGQKDEKNREAVCDTRHAFEQNRIEHLDEFWLLATDQKNLKELFDEIEKWNRENRIVQSVRIFVLKDIPDITSKNQADAFHNMAMKVVAFAKSKVRNSGGKLLISLAGGRKTMSSDLQDAAYCFGFDALLHILSSENSIIPMVVAENVPGNESLNDLPQSEIFRFDERNFLEWNYFDDKELNCLNAVRERLEESRCFYSTLYRSETSEDSREMFPALYTLSLTMRDKLKKCKIGISPKTEALESTILRALPKSDLHCHLGGVLRTEELVEVAETLEDDVIAEKERNEKFADWIGKIDIERFENPCLKDCENSENKWRGWKNWRKKACEETNAPEALIVPAFLLKFKDRENLLDEILYGDWRNEECFCATAKENKNAKGELSLAEYESYGDLQGSALLKTEKTVRKTVQILLRHFKEENLKYLELRCSPINYCTEKLTAKRVVVAILEELDKEKEIVASVLFIVSRTSSENKNGEEIMENYNALIRELNDDSDYGELFKRYFRGFDLAGDERMGTPENALKIFEKPLESCANITIHAGETMDVKNIWQAVYKLNAERIGHGLTLKDNAELCKKFLERRIGIEMCPSSNYQIVGFRDNYFRKQWGRNDLEKYPLKKYLDEELRVCLNTDDPGISRTDITREYLKAGRLTNGGLSLWDLLLLCYNGFALAFYPYKEKKKMLSRINALVYRWVKDQNSNIDKLLETQNEK